MTHSNDSQRPRRTRRQVTAAAVALLVVVEWARQVSAAEMHTVRSAASSQIGAGSIRVLAIDPDTPATLYAGTDCFGVFKSLDGGDSWTPANSGLLLGQCADRKDIWVCFPVLALAINPTTPTTLYAGTYAGGVFQSTDRGGSWSAFNTGLTNPYVRALAINPTTPATLYAGADGGGGVFRSTNGGGNWSEVNTGLTDAAVYALAINPTTPTTLYAGTYAGGVFRSLNAGSSWNAVNTGLANQYVRALAINPVTPTTLYAGSNVNEGVFRSLNAGDSWQSTELGRNVRALAINPATPTTLYAGTDAGVFKSRNGGASWSSVNAGLANQYVNALAINPATPTTVYVGTDGGVFRSVNEGSSWQSTGLGDVICGDGFAACREQCDDGNLSDGDGCDSNCTPTGCGNGIVTAGEECDDGNTYPGDGCDAACRREFCGDGIVQPGLGEECEDGNTVNGDGCDVNCTLTACGNGIITTGEQCDDGNRNPFDGCTSDCTVCGDGVITPPEECDDGNTPGGGACDARCQLPHVVGTGTPQSCTEAAFDAALAQGSVRFNCGPAPVTITVTSEKVLAADTSIDGGGLVTLSGGAVVRVLRVEFDAHADVRNLTLVDGFASNDDHVGGGAIYNGGTLALSDCMLRGNSTSTVGGGIHNDGTLTVTDCTLSGNSANWGGGGIFNNELGTVTLTNCRLSGNSSSPEYGVGGGIYNLIGTLTLTNCTLNGNSADLVGGGIANYTYCGPMFPICGQCGSATVTNSTLLGNSANKLAGGIGGQCPTSVTNSIIANSSGDNCGSTGDGRRTVTDGGHNLQFPGTSCGATIPSLDPLLDPAGLTDNGGPTQTIALLPGSPAIDAGDAEVCANPPVNGVDQRGHPRPGADSVSCSIGAFESDYPPPPCTGDCDGTGSVTVDEIITLVNVALDIAQASACPHGVPSGADVDVALIIQAVNVALSGCGVSLAEQGCLTSGGTVTSAMCCASAGDFPDTCAIGACGCAPDTSHAVRVCECTAGSCFDGSGCVQQ